MADHQHIILMFQLLKRKDCSSDVMMCTSISANNLHDEQAHAQFTIHREQTSLEYLSHIIH